jgi:hypothetical protein
VDVTLAFDCFDAPREQPAKAAIVDGRMTVPKLSRPSGFQAAGSAPAARSTMCTFRRGTREHGSSFVRMPHVHLMGWFTITLVAVIFVAAAIALLSGA